jgi:hypothetical protein
MFTAPTAKPTSSKPISIKASSFKPQVTFPVVDFFDEIYNIKSPWPTQGIINSNMGYMVWTP